MSVSPCRLQGKNLRLELNDSGQNIRQMDNNGPSGIFTPRWLSFFTPKLGRTASCKGGDLVLAANLNLMVRTSDFLILPKMHLP